MTPNCINIWAVGRMNDTVLTDVVGLSMGITNSFGTAIFIGLNSALYTFFPMSIGSKQMIVCG